MGSVKYLNGVLTVLTVVMSLNLWTTWTATPGGQRLSLASQAKAAGFANPDAQREQMIGLLKKLNVQLDQMNKTMTDGSMRVKVSGK